MELASRGFQTLLEKCGIVLKEDGVNIITQEKSLVIRSLEKELKDRPITDFIAGIKEICADESVFCRALKYTLQKKDADDNNVVEQNGIIHIFLSVEIIQTELLEILLQQLLDQASSERTNSPSFLLILKTLQYLPFIKDPKTLTTTLLDVIDIGNLESKVELLYHLPEIIPDSQCDLAAYELGKIMEEHPDLAGNIIDCLNAFCLSEDAKLKMQHHIIDQMLLSSHYHKIFPILFEFLTNNCKPDSLINVLLKSRQTLDKIMCSDNSTEKVIIFKSIQTMLYSNKNLFNGFVNMFNTITGRQDHKAIDIFLLFTLHSTFYINNARKKIVEVIFKKRIKNGLLSVNLFEKVFEKCFVQQTFSDNFNSMLDIAAGLLQFNDRKVVQMGCTLYKLLFSHELSSQAHRQDTLSKLLILMGPCYKYAELGLSIIKDLLNCPKLQQHTLQLMRMLNMLNTLKFKEVKQVFEILCHLICRIDSDQSQSCLKDELNVLIRKQLSCVSHDVKVKGIISAIVMTKHIATVLEEQEGLNVTIESIGDLPIGRPQEAALLLEMTTVTVTSIPKMMGLYFDELSGMVISSEHLDCNFMSWIFETTRKDFQNEFTIDSPLESILGVPLETHFVLNSSKETSQYIGINIAEQSIKISSSESNNVLTLAPLFRLVRLLHQKLDNGLSGIDALLGCGVILPSLDLENKTMEQLKQTADCIFYCINWFRELISAFVTQSKIQYRKKVITRLMQLIELEELLKQFMEQVPNHKLPPSYFDNTSHVSSPIKVDVRKPPAKRFKSNAMINDTVASSTQIRTSQLKSQAPKRGVLKIEHTYNFRELDTDIIVLLKYPLNINPTTDSQTIILHIRQFQFILKDFISKLNVLTKQKDIGLSHLNVINPVDLITDCKRLIPSIQNQTDVIVEKIKSILEEHDDRYDLPELFTDEVNDLKVSFSLVLQFYSLIFNWSGFQNVSHNDLLQACLKCFQKQKISQSLFSQNRPIIELAKKLLDYTELCIYLPTAVYIIEILEALYNTNFDNEIRKITISASERLLQKKWFNLEREHETGRQSYEKIDTIIKAYLKDMKVNKLYGIVGTLLNEVDTLRSKEDSLPMMGSIDRGNFHVLYRDLCTALSTCVKIELSSLTNNEHLNFWRTMTLTMQGLMTIGKTHDSRSNQSWFLKRSIMILKVFLSHGMPILEIMMSSKTEQVTEIFKILQTSTRYLHYMCCNSKVTKDASIINSVPQFRLVIETLIYKVKAALVANKCSEAFWMGNLRNRNLQGEDILSQSTISNNEIEDELPLESDDEIEVEPEENSGRNSSASEVYDA